MNFSHLRSTAVILAAGLGTRMASSLPKAAHAIAGLPMLNHLIRSTERVFDKIIVVIGPEMEVLAKLSVPHKVVVQHERLGTAHAALQASAHYSSGPTAILFADNPLITSATMSGLLQMQCQKDADVILTAMRPKDQARYGRVIVKNGQVIKIVEWVDATDDEKEVTLCNAGALCANGVDLLQWLKKVDNHNNRQEYYLTDVIKIANQDGAIIRYLESSEEELIGINSRKDLVQAEHYVQEKLRYDNMEKGVTFLDPATVHMCWDTKLAADVTIHPYVVFGPGVKVEKDAVIHSFSHLQQCLVRKGATIGPYARLRPGADIGPGAKVGNFVEIKETKLGQGVNVNHLSYIGDGNIGEYSNIGAGTIFCNYDGVNKHRTIIAESTFVGSNTTLVAPLTIGKGAFVAAGSVLTENVPPGDIAFGRARQVNKRKRIENGNSHSEKGK